MCKSACFLQCLEIPSETNYLQCKRRAEYKTLLVRGLNDCVDRHRQSAQQPEQPIPPTGQMLMSRFQAHPLSDDYISCPSDHTSDGGSSVYSFQSNGSIVFGGALAGPLEGLQVGTSSQSANASHEHSTSHFSATT
ncbi:hypothetical protein CBOM_05723 [Ceraceosorus bombacis]|uniref:Uncharacterized protein n=1 Tax=Ceraceosorus bombacis TaxID=401625 RepID=A0A0P1BS79_9BASI|nr:hypothetical protein CBOM_05723 [Ceraceosorus bombacis]